MEDIININNRDFLIVKELKHNNTNYIYAIANDDTNEVALVKEINDGNSIVGVTDIDEFNLILNLINKSE